MVLVKLHGGLGNQMFQYAAARSLIKNEGCVSVDTRFFKKTDNTETFTARQYELGIFENIKAREASGYYVNLFNSNALFFKLRRKSLKSSIKFIEQKGHNYEYISFQEFNEFKYLYLDGYFQSEKYFKHIRIELLNEFEFPALDKKNEILKKKIENSTNSVSIHIRRADYLKPIFSDVIGVLPVDYYYNALTCLGTSLADKNLFIFSDDIEWVKENFTPKEENFFFIENNKEEGWKDMALMTACKHHIIANSSFSWWGAWLSKNSGKIFAPHNWFNPLKVKFNILDFISDGWNIIQYE